MSVELCPSRLDIFETLANVGALAPTGSEISKVIFEHRNGNKNCLNETGGKERENYLIAGTGYA